MLWRGIVALALISLFLLPAGATGEIPRPPIPPIPDPLEILGEIVVVGTTPDVCVRQEPPSVFVGECGPGAPRALPIPVVLA